MTTKSDTITVTDLQLQIARKSFPDYCDFVHNRPLFRHQIEWGLELQVKGAKTALICPPETYKSSTVRMFVEWKIGNFPDSTHLWVMNTSMQAEKQVMAIKETIEHNARYHAVFPHIQPDVGRGWTKERLFVKRKNASNPDPTLFGTGIDGPYQGSHVDAIYLDDPTDQEDVRSETKMQAQRDRLRGVLIDRLHEGGSFVALMTRWGEADLYRDYMEMGFNILQQPLVGRYPWGRLLCPELFPDDKIESLRKEKGSALFALTFMCDPGAASGSMVKRDWWQYAGEMPEAPRHKRIHSWDLSIGKTSTADYSAFTSWVVADNGYYLVDAGRWQLTPDERLAMMTKLAVRDDPGYVVVEESVPSMDFIDTLKKRTRLPLVLSKPGGKDKVARLQAVLPYIETGKVFLPSKAPWVNDFLDEMAAFPGGRNDDWVDSTSQALAFMKKRWGREQSDTYEEPIAKGRRGHRVRRPSFAGGRW